MGIKSTRKSESYYNYYSDSGKEAIKGAPIPITATGGTKATPGDGYIYHLFSPADPGNFVITEGTAKIDCLIVGGGAGGGYDRGGGGGAGAFKSITLFGVTGTHPVTIGAHGGGGSGGNAGSNGSATTFAYDSVDYIAHGGGGGGGDSAQRGGSNAPGYGSGGGCTASPLGTGGPRGGEGGGDGDGSPMETWEPVPQGAHPGPLTRTGYPGKRWFNPAEGGGGGGAGSGGPRINTSTNAMVGGEGKTLPWIPTAYGVTGYFAGGGAGGGNGYPNGTQPPSSPGGGGKGGFGPSSPEAATTATAKTGSGGGGGSGSGPTTIRSGSDGAPGIVLLRYAAT